MSKTKDQKKFGDLCVGDEVYVVNQRRRGSSGRRRHYEVVTKVGRKYGYISLHRREKPFCLETGYSVHKEGYQRVNDYGFDVYKSEEEFNYMQHCQEQKRRLQDRLLDRLGRIVDLNPEIVDKFNDILDEEGLD